LAISGAINLNLRLFADIPAFATLNEVLRVHVGQLRFADAVGEILTAGPLKEKAPLLFKFTI